MIKEVIISRKIIPIALLLILLIVKGGRAVENSRVILTFGSLGEAEAQFNQPQGICVDKEGNIFVADTGNNRVQKFNNEGNYLSGFGQFGWEEGEFSNPFNIAIDSEANIYVTDSGNKRVQKFNKDGTFLQVFPQKGMEWEIFEDPESIGIDSFDNIYITDSGKNCLFKFDNEGNLLLKLGKLGEDKGEFKEPKGIALDDKGNIYVADTGNNRVQKFSPEGEFLTLFGGKGSEPGEFLSPQGIAINRKGVIYVADTGNNRIQKFSPEGKFIAQFGENSLENIQFNSPSDLAVDILEYIYIVDTGNNRIVKIAEAIKEGILIRGEKTFDLSYANISKGSKSQFFTDYPGIYPGINLDETLRVDVRSEPFKDIEVSGHFDDTSSILERQNIWLKIEGRNFGARLGNYRASFDDTEFGLYNKTLTGIKLYGEIGRLKLEAIGAKIEGISCRDEFEAEEMELTYYLSRHPVVEGSEKVKVDEKLKIRDIDYEIDYLAGIITFSEFLKVDSKIVVEYEYMLERIARERMIYGIRAKEEISEKITLGATFLNESDETKQLLMPRIGSAPIGHSVYGVDINYGSKGKFDSFFEYAESELNSNLLNKASIDDMQGNAKITTLSDKISDWDKVEWNIDSFLALREDFIYKKEGDSSLALDYTLNDYGSEAYCAQSFIISKDYSMFESLKLWGFSDRNTGASLSIEFVENDIVYSFVLPIDWQGQWKIIRVDLPDGLFDKEGNHPSLREVEEIRLKLSNPTHQSLDGILYIDTLSTSLEKRWDKIEIDGENYLKVSPINEEIDPTFIPYPPSLDYSPQALSLRYTFNKEEMETYVSVTQTFYQNQDFSPYQELTLGVFNKGGHNQGRLSIDLVSTHQDYFYYALPLNFPSGWESVRINLNDFSQYGSPSKEKIISIRLYISKEDSPLGKENEIYIDAIHLEGAELIKGKAFKAEIHTEIGKLNLDAQYRGIDSNFAMIGKPRLDKNRQDLRLGAKYSLTENIFTDVGYEDQIDSKQGILLNTRKTSANCLFSFVNLPKLKVGYQLKEEKNQGLTEKVNKSTQTYLLRLFHRWGISDLTADYQINNLKDFTQVERDQVKTIAAIKLAVFPSEKINISGIYEISEDKTLLESPFSKVTTTTTFNLKAMPSKALSASGSYSVRKLEDSLTKDTSEISIADLTLKFEPSRIIESNARYRVKIDERIINGIKIPIRDTVTLLGLKIAPSEKLSVRVRYRTKDIYDLLQNITASSGKDLDLTLAIKPTKSLIALAKYSVDLTSRESLDRTTQTSSLELKNKFSEKLSAKAKYILKERKEISVSGEILDVSKTASFGIDYIFSKFLLGSASYTTEDNKGVSITKTSRVGLTYSLGARTKVKTDIRITSGQGAPSDFIKTVAGLAIEYNLSKNISLQGRYNLINCDKNRDEDDYQANTANLYVRIIF